MMYVLKLKNLVTMLLFVFVLCFSCLCSAGITFQADGGKNFVLDFNNKNGCGQYVLLDASDNIVFTFDFDTNSQEFTTYKADGSLLAIRKMLSWDRMLHKEQPHHDFIVCVRRGDGDYYRENHSSPSFYEHTPKAFNTFLQNKEYFSVKPSAGISFQADGGKNFVLDFNNKNSCGRYVLLDASGNIVFTFDFDTNSQEFTTYKADGSLLAIRKMLSWDRMLHKDQPNHDFIVCVRRGDGDYYRENHSSPSFYEHTPKAFNTFLQNKEYFDVKPSAGISFQADGGKNFVLDFNNKNSCGRYVLLDASGNIVFTFDFDANSQEFTTYKADGSLLAIRKMLSWDRMLHKEQPHHDFIVCVRRGDGDYYRENHSSPSFYEHTPKAFNTFLQNKDYFGVR